MPESFIYLLNFFRFFPPPVLAYFYLRSDSAKKKEHAAFSERWEM